jgi:hypothetical protein
VDDLVTMTKILYDGPSGQTNLTLGDLEPGKTYEVDEKTAKSLVSSHSGFKTIADKGKS